MVWTKIDALIYFIKQYNCASASINRELYNKYLNVVHEQELMRGRGLGYTYTEFVAQYPIAVSIIRKKS